MKKHTDSGFTFDIQGDHAVVMEIDGNPQIVKFPVKLMEFRLPSWRNICFPAKAAR